MQIIRPIGRHASVRKYDILTALGTFALAAPKHVQRRVLRFMTLVTARYNWANNRLAVGQREIARLWSVDTRTVKREMAELRAMGWLVLHRQGARGRVAEYGVDLDTIASDTERHWSAVGPDFELRMSGAQTTDATVVPLPVQPQSSPPDVSDGTEWSLAKALLYGEDPGVYSNWIASLKRADRIAGRLVLQAPTRFHGTYVQTHLERRILAACRDVDQAIEEIRIVAG